MGCQTLISIQPALMCVFLTLFAFTPILGFQVEGDLHMTNASEEVENANIGDLITFTFGVTLKFTSDVNVAFVFTGDTLKFPDIPSHRAVIWDLSSNTTDNDDNDDDGNIFSNMFVDDCVDVTSSNGTGNASLGFCYNGTEDIDERMQFSTQEKTSLILNVTSSLSNGLWKFNGSFIMQLREDAIQGSLVRGILSMWVVENDKDIRTAQVVSDYVFTPAPGITVDTPSSLVQPILGKFSTHVILNTSRDSLSVKIGCLTPYENESNEVMLTVQSMQVLPSETYGVHENTTEYLEKYGLGVLTSTIGSYQNNMAVLALSRVPRRTDKYSKMEVKSSFVVRVEDYSQLANNDVFPVMMSLRFRDNMIWLGEIRITLSAPEFRRPFLKVTTSQTKQCPYDGRTSAYMTVLVAHDPSSTATAYNVTLNIYLPPYITMTSKTYSTPKENKITVEQDGSVINAEIARLTFSDPFTLTMVLDLDLSDPSIMEAQNRIVTAEALYNDRWGNLTDLLTDTAYMSIFIKKHCAKRISWGQPGNCVAGACSCAPTGNSPTKCAPCGELWRCKAFVNVPNFDKISKIQSKGILCEASIRRRSSATTPSCYKELKSPTRYMELSHRVGLITGLDSDTGNFYGISNNGAIYLMSGDGALTWASVTQDDYEHVTSQTSFQWATFI